MNEVVIKQARPIELFGYRIHEWQAVIRQHVVSSLWLVPIHTPDGTIDRFGVANIRTDAQHLRQGHARALHEAASQVAPVWHATGDRLTRSGAAFADAVGGPVLTQEEADKYLPSTTWLTWLAGRNHRS